MSGNSGQCSNHEIDSDKENEVETQSQVIRRPVVIIQLDVKHNQNIETFLVDLKKDIEKRRTRNRLTITESIPETPQVNIPYKFKLKTWEWTSKSPYLNYQKYHRKDKKYTTTHHLVACYYRMGPSGAAEVFLVSNAFMSLKRFLKYSNSEFPLKIAKRLVDCNTVTKDSAHHLIGSVFTNTRILRNNTMIDFNDIPVLLLGFTASLREQASILKLSPFNFSTKDHQVVVGKFSVRFITPLSLDEEIIVLDHLCTIIRGERTYKWNLNKNLNVVEQDVDLPLDVTEVDKSVAIELNYQMAHSIYTSIIQNTRLDLSLHFPASFVARSEIKFGTKSLCHFKGTPPIAEVLGAVSASGKFNTKKSPKLDILWNILRKFRIHLLGYDDELQLLTKPSLTTKNIVIVDAMHGAVHYKDNIYWRFCSKWYLVSSDRLAVVQHKFRQLLENNLMSDQDPGYLSKKFSMPKTSVESDSQGSDTSTQQSSRENLEYDYNCSYATEPNVLVGDKITANNIEIFDLLRYDQNSDKLWIYHVKRKFGQCTRDATSQLAISAKLIHDDIVGSGEKTLHIHYAKLAERPEINAKLTTWGVTCVNDYVNLFRKRKLTFVYAFVDEDNKTTKRTFKEESQIKAVVTIADLIEKLKHYKCQVNDPTNFASIIRQMSKQFFGVETPDDDPSDLETIAQNLFNFLIRVQLIGSDGKVTSKLLFGINFNNFESIDPSVQKFHEFLLKFNAKINFFEFMLKPYRSLYQTLIGKIELQRIHQLILEKGFDFQICEIEQCTSNGSAPVTPISNVAVKRDSSGSSSCRKRQKTGGSTSKKKEVPKGQPLISDRLKFVARKLSLNSQEESEEK